MKIKYVSDGGSVEYIDRPSDYKRSAHWTEDEICNKSATDAQTVNGVRGIDTPDTRLFFQALELFRQILIDVGLITYISTSSNYRTETFNKAVGGVANSSHLTGEALDWNIQKGGVKENVRGDATRMAISGIWESVCKQFDRVGYICWYTNGFHLDFKKGPTQFKIYNYVGTKSDW